MMKTLNDYMEMSYRLELVEDKEEGGYVASYPDLPGCITCGDTIEEAVSNAKDAKKAWLEAALEEGIEIYEPDSLEGYSGQFKSPPQRWERWIRRWPGSFSMRSAIRQP